MESHKNNQRMLKEVESSFFNIKEYGRSRLLYDMLHQVKKKAKLSPNYLVLVLDDYTAKVMSRFCDVFDLMENGSVYQIEKLGLHRKRYPQSDVIYFVRPTKQSIEKIAADFPLNDEFDYD
jgi:hypothetical protein